MKFILLIGNCGVGKTWVMKQLIKKFALSFTGRTGMVLFHKNQAGVHVLGKYDGSTFEGSDKLSMAVMRDVPEYLKYIKKYRGITIVEGDRFTNQTFMKLCKPIVIRVNGDGVEGRKQRGSSQTERQIKSIATRVSNFFPKHEVPNSKRALKLICEYVDNR